MFETLREQWGVVVNVIQKLDGDVSRWSQDREEKHRREQLEQLMLRLQGEFDDGGGSYTLLSAYRRTLSDYRRVLKLREPGGSYPGRPSNWVENNGNEVESEFFRISAEINENPALISYMYQIRGFLPF